MTHTISQQRRGSLQRQLILWVNTVLVVLTVIALIYDYSVQKKILTANFHASMQQAASHVALALANSQTMESATNTLDEYCKVMSGHDDPNHTISLINNKGEVVVSSKNIHLSKEKTNGFIVSEENTWTRLQINGETYTQLSIPFKKQWSNKNFEGAIQYIDVLDDT